MRYTHLAAASQDSALQAGGSAAPSDVKSVVGLKSDAVRATPNGAPGATLQAASRRLASLRPAAALPHWGWPGRLARSFVKGIVAFQAPKKKLPIVIKNLDSIRTPL